MSNDSIKRLFAIIDSFSDQIIKSGAVPVELISEVENILGVRFPESYRLFLNRYGAIKIGDICIYGISNPTNQEPSIVWALNGLWKTSSTVPKDLIPIRFIPDSKSLICIQCQQDEAISEASLVQWELESRPDAQKTIQLGLDFASYVSECLITTKHRMAALKVMEEHIADFEREYLSIGKLPRNHIWRPYRFCSQDVILGLTVVRHSIDNNCLEVDVCLTSDIPEFEEGSGAKVTTSFLLSEAYKCGGSMEIRFSDNVESRHVPSAICELAKKYGVKLEHVLEGRITTSESKELFLAITEFNPKLRECIEGLARSGNLSRERASYVVHHGIWSRPEIEHLILGCNRVDKILGGEAQPEQRLFFQNDILHARAAIMGGFLDRKLAKKEQIDGDVAVDLEDDIRPIKISFDPTYYAKFYSCPEELPIPWIFSDGSTPKDITTDRNLLVFLRARDSEDLNINLMKDLSLASNLKSSLGLQSETFVIGCLVPRDFEDLQPDLQNKLMLNAKAQGIYILVCPETTVTLDSEANRRLVSSRIIRE